MKVSEKMTRNVHLAGPDDTLQQAAHMMADYDTGVLPVSQDDRLVGMITDRDIALRGVAQGKGIDAKVREVMTPDVKYCFGRGSRTRRLQHGLAAGPPPAGHEP